MYEAGDEIGYHVNQKGRIIQSADFKSVNWPQVLGISSDKIPQLSSTTYLCAAIRNRLRQVLPNLFWPKLFCFVQWWLGVAEIRCHLNEGAALCNQLSSTVFWFDLVWFDLIWFDLIWFDLNTKCQLESPLLWFFGPLWLGGVVMRATLVWITFTMNTCKHSNKGTFIFLNLAKTLNMLKRWLSGWFHLKLMIGLLSLKDYRLRATWYLRPQFATSLHQHPEAEVVLVLCDTEVVCKDCVPDHNYR